MGKYLITGRGGSGKSTICRELNRRGLPAFDADNVPGLCRWEDRQSGEPIAVDPADYIDFKIVAWAWQDAVLRQLLETHNDLILCGSSSNQDDYHHIFDAVFVLTLDPHTHDRRLRTRDFEYGKHPALRRELVVHHQLFANRMIAAGALGIDVTQPPEKVADEILSHCEFTDAQYAGAAK